MAVRREFRGVRLLNVEEGFCMNSFPRRSLVFVRRKHGDERHSLSSMSGMDITKRSDDRPLDKPLEPSHLTSCSRKSQSALHRLARLHLHPPRHRHPLQALSAPVATSNGMEWGIFDRRGFCVFRCGR